MTRSEFKDLAAQRILRLDGATGTELAKRGMPAGVCPEAWILDHPDAIIDVQQNYAAAGSDIIYAPTFGANPLKLAEFGLEEQTGTINRELARLSRRALPDRYVFGDIGVAITSFFVGFCGFFVYPLLILCIYASVALISGKRYFPAAWVVKCVLLLVAVFFIKVFHEKNYIIK